MVFAFRSEGSKPELTVEKDEDEILTFDSCRLKVEYAYVGALIAAAVAFYVPFIHFSLRIPGVDKIYRLDTRIIRKLKTLIVI